MSEEKKDCWDIDCTVETSYRVVFDQDITKEEAMLLFKGEQYYDIIDEFGFNLIKVHSVS